MKLQILRNKGGFHQLEPISNLRIRVLDMKYLEEDELPESSPLGCDDFTEDFPAVNFGSRGDFVVYLSWIYFLLVFRGPTEKIVRIF